MSPARGGHPMCRFVLYLGPAIRLSSLISEPENSIIHQSFHSHEREEPLNGDGFGVAWYQLESSPKPGLFRSITPAWSNASLLHLARLTDSPCVLAHVRAASPGLPVAEINTHPFAWGPYAFMHNGELAGFAAFKRRLVAGLSDHAFELIGGTTDSEHLFAVFADELLARGGAGGADAMAEALVAAVRRVLRLAADAGVGEASELNLAVADGRQAIACRITDGNPDDAPSLYLHRGSAYSCEDGACRMLAAGDGGGAAIVASEPLSADPGWTRVPANHLVLLRGAGAAELVAFEP